MNKIPIKIGRPVFNQDPDPEFFSDNLNLDFELDMNQLTILPSHKNNPGFIFSKWEKSLNELEIKRENNFNSENEKEKIYEELQIEALSRKLEEEFPDVFEIENAEVSNNQKVLEDEIERLDQLIAGKMVNCDYVRSFQINLDGKSKQGQ